jgi:phosphatidylserine decarboxylase
MKIAKGCISWVISPIILTILFLFMTIYINTIFQIGFILFLILTIFFLIFFRDPYRKIGEGIVSPADGKISDIKIDNKVCFISIFMNIDNVHVNRMPINGTVLGITHYPGKHFGAWKKESNLNEKVVIDINSNIGKVKVVQIAGLIARRIYPYVKKGDTVDKGDKIGIIRLGSRVDIYLPANIIKKVLVDLQNKVYAGVTTIAEIK